MHKAHRWETFPKRGAKFGYYIILGPLNWDHPHPCACTKHCFRKTTTTDQDFKLTKISSFPPKWAATLLKSSSRAWRSLTSQTEPSTFQPAALQVAKLFSRSSPDLAHVYTETPNPASSSTIARLQDTNPETSF